jgi:hypothetical protein
MFKLDLFNNRKKCFFEKDRVCDRECRAYDPDWEKCTIVARLKEKADAGECSALLRTLCEIDCDPEKLVEKFPELVPPPKLVYEE